MVLENGRIFARGGNFIDGKIRFGSVVEEIGASVRPSRDEPCLDVGGGYVIPGLVDIHIHGAMGQDVCDATPEAIEAISRYCARNGVTSFCPTTMTLPENKLIKIMDNLSRAAFPGAKRAGIHMEGPFISAARKGAQPEEAIRKPDIEMFRRLQKAAGNGICLVDIAPEEDEGFRFTTAVSEGCHVSFAHTSTDYRTATAGFACGADHVAHLFNAMSFHHHDPGLVGAALDGGAYVELICDGHHVHPSLVKAIFGLFPPQRICLISDSLRCAGMPDGKYTLAGQDIYKKDGWATLESGVLAGSTISLMEAVRCAVRFGVPLEQAVAAATRNPAASIGMENHIGTLTPRAAADLVVLDRDLEIRQVFIQGEPFLR
jgi:N-acetylglucosamine-6-phosphate deacetylase